MTSVVGVRVDLTSYDVATQVILDWSVQRESRYVCVANVHMLMETYDSLDYQNVINTADLITPDGMPLVWILRLKGYRNQKRIYGPTLLLHILEAAAHKNVPVGFYGSTPIVLQSLLVRMKERFPNLNIAYSFSPPFNEVTQEEDAKIIDLINASSLRILLVGLGCPKQERWMAQHRGKINAVMIGVGAAFDFHAGAKPQAPNWMQNVGMEWFFRFITEPRRLWRRYLYHNPRFIYLAIMDLLGFLR